MARGFFTKMLRGEYVFTIDGITFTAVKNVAGFSGRAWDLYRGGRIVSDQLATRTECVEDAELIVKRERGQR